jgi:histidyl-tRNA synthetase
MTKHYLQPVRGTKDLHSQDILQFNHIIDIAKKQAKYFSFEELQTPIFEFSEIFQQNLGESSDIINKEVYAFLDRSNHSLTLRPEFTASIARSMLSNSELLQILPRKIFSYGPLFRYDRPQKGRQRQFHQINYEIFGCDSIYTDAEIILLATNILQNLGVLNEVNLQINSLGCDQTKKNYSKALHAYFSDFIHQLSPDSQNRLHRNPLRILDSKDEIDLSLIAKAPQIANFYSNQAQEKFQQLVTFLTKCNISYTINTKLVRGLDYYTSTVFEFVMQHNGAQNTVLAGGRYDNLIANMSGKKAVSAIGFASGIERLMLINQYQTPISNNIAVCYVATEQHEASFHLANLLRQNSFTVFMLNEGNLTKQLKYANNKNCQFALILGEDEIKNNNILCKNLLTAHQELLLTNDIISFLKQNNA